MKLHMYNESVKQLAVLYMIVPEPPISSTVYFFLLFYTTFAAGWQHTKKTDGANSASGEGNSYSFSPLKVLAYKSGTDLNRQRKAGRYWFTLEKSPMPSSRKLCTPSESAAPDALLQRAFTPLKFLATSCSSVFTDVSI